MPAGICFATVVADGGHGGASASLAAGGSSASVSARVTVTPGDHLSVLVGGAGGAGTANPSGVGGIGGIG
ncbi:MAG: hypothetical protein MUP97_02965, partial [Acidimicrobiia bacterium]|nr:hypothetical protein [Acidimicrobiia bacterium]